MLPPLPEGYWQTALLFAGAALTAAVGIGPRLQTLLEDYGTEKTAMPPDAATTLPTAPAALPAASRPQAESSWSELLAAQAVVDQCYAALQKAVAVRDAKRESHLALVNRDFGGKAA